MNDSLSFQVEIFADLMVHIDDPFARRDAVFASAGIDEASYQSLVDAWRARFDRDETGKLASRFADAYAEARERLHDASARHADRDGGATDPRFLNADAQTFREEAAKVAREPITERATPPIPREAPIAMEAPMTPFTPAPTFTPPIVHAPIVATDAEKRAPFAGTMDISHAIPRESLPFVPQAAIAPRPAEPPAKAAAFAGTADISAFIPRAPLPFSDAGPPTDRPTAALPTEPEAPSASGVRRPPQAFAGTADISAFIPRPATPFAGSPPPVAAPSTPRKRLIRFDPQTGQPLPTPIWVDLPPEPEGQKK